MAKDIIDQLYEIIYKIDFNCLDKIFEEDIKRYSLKQELRKFELRSHNLRFCIA